MNSLKGRDIASNKICESAYGNRLLCGIDCNQLFDNEYNYLLKNGIDMYLKKYKITDDDVIFKYKKIWNDYGGDLPSTNTIRAITPLDEYIYSSKIIIESNTSNTSNPSKYFNIINIDDKKYTRVKNIDYYNIDNEDINDYGVFVIINDDMSSRNYILYDYLSEDDLIYVFLYTYNGDNLINQYILSNGIITQDIVNYYKDKYLNTFINYDVTSKCFKEDSIKYIKCYIEYITERFQNCMDKIKHTLPNKDFFLYRGLSFDNIEKYISVKEQYINLIGKSMAVETIPYVSTSINIENAKSFYKKQTTYGLLFKIYVPKNFKNYIPILDVSFFPENEIVLEVNTKWFIDNVIDDIVYCQLIP